MGDEGNFAGHFGTGGRGEERQRKRGLMNFYGDKRLGKRERRRSVPRARGKRGAEKAAARAQPSVFIPSYFLLDFKCIGLKA